ncbi:MAG: hypothetical protein R3B96_12750 [Pirellulaceae bacterium]
MPHDPTGRPLLDALQAINTAEPAPIQIEDRSLRSDLQAILRRALAKRQSDRYASAGELGADLQRVLEHRPVEARRMTWWYQASKFVRRYRRSAAVVGVFLLVVSIAVSLIANAWRNEFQARGETIEAYRQATANQRLAFGETLERLSDRGDWRGVLSTVEQLRKLDESDSYYLSFRAAQAHYALCRGSTWPSKSSTGAGRHESELGQWLPQCRIARHLSSTDRG